VVPAHWRPSGRFLNRSITLSIIGEISCGDGQTRAYLVQLQRLIAVTREAQKILPRAFADAADCMPQHDLRGSGIHQFAS
jgi:hypothetical protein